MKKKLLAKNNSLPTIIEKAKQMSRLSTQLTALLIVCACAFMEPANAQVGTWTALTNLAPDDNNGVMLVMTDGSILCHTSTGGNLQDGTIWDRLTPDSAGNYLKGTWTKTAGMTQERFSFSSAVLKDGRLYAAGGEYGTDGTQAGYHGEVYSLTANTWTEISGSTTKNIISDGSCKLLDNGDMIQALVDVSFPVHTVIFNPTTNAYTAGPSTLHGSNESMWLKLPDNSVLFVDEDAQTSERYIPSLNQWIADGNVPVSLYDPYGYECGPAWMLPDGRAFFIGATNKTAFYTPSGTNAAGTWAAGPDVPNGYGMPDAPGVMMPNGKILFACEPQPTSAQNEFISPTKFYEFDYTTNAFTAVAAPSTASTNSISQQYSLLQLPNGTVLCGLNEDNSSKQYYIYTPVGTPVASGKPVISTVTPLTCTTYMATGHGFNGISEGSAFGDENECDSNYPLFRFTSGGKVYYARSYNWNSTGVQRGLKADTAYFTIPTTMTSGSYYMYAVANGIASDSILFVDVTPSLSSSLTPPSICTGTAFTYTPTSTTQGATFTWTRAAIAGISNAAITTAQTTNPNEVLVDTTSTPITVNYTYSVTGSGGTGCSNIQTVAVVVNPKPTASFTAAPVSACFVPDSVTFTNTSIAGVTYVWNFGDNNTSTVANPVHPYNAAGTFSIKLVATSLCGTDSITKANLVAVTPPSAPTATSPVNISCGAKASLSATATGTDSLKWFGQATGGSVLGTGTSFVTPSITTSTTYYVANYATPTASYCPPLSYNFGGEQNYTNDNFRSDVFNVNQACTLVSVQVNSGVTGNRTIQLQDASGNVLQSAVINIPSGVSVVTLNFPLSVGTGYQLGCGDNATTTNLSRNVSGAAFPYTDPSGYVTITGNNVPDAVHFYFFYDWKLEGPSCISARTPVVVNIASGLTLNPTITAVACNGGTGGAATITPVNGTPGYTYSWSGGQTSASITGVGAGNYTVTVHDAVGCSGTATETIGQPSALGITVTPVGASCGGNTGSASAAVSGGTPGYTYKWSNAATTASVSSLAPANYTLTVTDANGCTATATTTITSSGGLNLTPSGVNVTCNGAATGSATVALTGGTGTITYHWSNGGNTATISNVVAGTYIVTVSETSGCSGTSTQTISQPAVLSVSATSTNSGCGSPNGSVTANVTGGTTSYSYLWSNAATTATVSNLQASTYIVTVTDNHQCTATTNVVVSNSGLLNLTTVPDVANCSGGSAGGASVNVNGGTSPFTYAWSNGNTTAAISGVAAGTYNVTVLDNTGCSGTSSAVVTLGSALTLSTSLTNEQCFNQNNGSASVTVTAGTSPYSYIWNNGSTASAISNLTAGNYYVTVTDAHNCITIDTLAVTQPGSITIFVTTVQPSCAGLSNGSATVTATGGTPSYSYNWSTNTNGTGVNSLAPGSYSITLTDANTCTSAATFNITNPTPVSVAIVTANDSCYGTSDGSIQITPGGGTGPYSFVWSNNILSASLNNLAAGTYSVTVTDIHNCSAVVSATITQPIQITVATSTTNATNGYANGTASIGTINGGNAPYSFTWSNGQTTNTITGLAAGTYAITITDQNGCEIIANAVVDASSVGIATVTSDLSFTVYPNPAKSEITVDAGALDKETTLVLEDILGQALMSKEIITTPVTIDLTNYSSGVYFIELRQNGRKSMQKFVISK